MGNNDTSIKAISERLVELRTFSDYTTKQMADLLKIEESVYIRYEQGTDEVPINIIYKIASLLETEPSYILNGLMPDNDEAVQVFDGKGLSIKRYEGYAFSSLAANFKNKVMNPMLVTMSPTDSPELVVHGGQEFNYVLEGELRVIVSLWMVIRNWLHIPLAGSSGLFMLGVLINLFAVTSMGILLACFARDMPQLGILMILVLLPMQILSGGTTPQSSMPPVIQYIMQLAPTTHFVQFGKAILFRGADFAIVWPIFLKMVAIGGIFFWAALRRFRRTVAA